jgi:pSer/pThr/pTyr-binding forkhead associated (FHA) protein
MGSEISRRLEEVKNTLSKEVLGNIPTAIVLGGPDDGKVFMLKHDQIRVGRIDPENQAAFSPDNDIVFSDGYTAVTRVSKPHGKFIRSNEGWHIEDCGSMGGTRLNTKRLEKNTSVSIHDGDLIEFSKGVFGVKLLMIIPQNN